MFTLPWAKGRTRDHYAPAGEVPAAVPAAAESIRFDFAGRQFAFHDLGGSDMVARAMQAGTYEAPLPIMVMAHVFRTQGLFLEVGANNGLYAILAAKTRPDARIVAFEPYAPAREAMLTNLALNDLVERVIVHDVALSDSAGEAVLHVPDSSHGSLETSASLEAGFKPASRTLVVQKARLDDVALDGPVAVMKIDVESHEAAVLRGAERLLAQDRPIVFAEMLDVARAQFSFLTTLFTGLDYAMFRLRPDCAIRTDVVRFDPIGWNYAFIPRESLPLFRECCAVHEVEILAPA